jgi:hypothetical protein
LPISVHQQLFCRNSQHFCHYLAKFDTQLIFN